MTSLRAKYQGDSLSLLLFIVCLVPFSKILEDAQKSYCLSQNAVLINHLVYMNDVKLYVTQNVKIESQVNTLLIIIIIFWDICMNIGHLSGM